MFLILVSCFSNSEELYVYNNIHWLLPEYHYSIKVNLANPSNAEPHVYGKMHISMYGTLGQLVDMNITPE